MLDVSLLEDIVSRQDSFQDALIAFSKAINTISSSVKVVMGTQERLVLDVNKIKVMIAVPELAKEITYYR